MGGFKRTKLACYTAYFTMSSVFCLPPLLFVVLRNSYHLSYTLLGTLVLTNFCTQLLVDLLFTVCSKKFNPRIIVKVMPLITTLGLLIYALAPTLFPNTPYVGLLLGTVVFSVAAGLSEVLLSPTIAAIPSENPQRDMSLLHSLYAFGVFTVVVVTTVFFRIFGTENWQYVTVFFALLPAISAILFMLSPMPDMSGAGQAQEKSGVKRKTLGTALCVACIFFGSCAENAMSNWVSGYMENALHVDKAFGDIIGLAAFAILLGLTRIWYAKFGKNISRVLLVGMLGAAGCYLIAGLSSGLVFAVIACVLTGLFTAMLWPGTLILMEEKMPAPGVGAYALMAAGGDLGAALAPQLMGVVADGVAASSLGESLGARLHLSAEQIGLKAGMLFSSIFPILGAAVVLVIMRYFKEKPERGLLESRKE
ncbi:MAG: MFS transporter [Clostridiales bacterium]|nr:MFS transporter [Clostridiales bacterium]